MHEGTFIVSFPNGQKKRHQSQLYPTALLINYPIFIILGYDPKPGVVSGCQGERGRTKGEGERRSRRTVRGGAREQRGPSMRRRNKKGVAL